MMTRRRAPAMPVWLGGVPRVVVYPNKTTFSGADVMQQSRVNQDLLKWLIVLVVIAGGFLAWEYLLKGDEPAVVSFSEEDWYGELLDPPQPAPKFELIDQHERPFRLQDQEGNVVVLFFGYTNCPDICP